MKDAASPISKARGSVASGRYLLAGGFAEQAGREAYLAVFHAAQAFIFSKTSREPKTHRGTRSEFARLTRDEPRVGAEFVSFLGRAYELKTVADYEETAPVTPEEARAALDVAARFIDAIAAIV